MNDHAPNSANAASTQKVLAGRRARARLNRWVLSVLGCVVVLAMAIAFMLPAISMTGDVARETPGIAADGAGGVMRATSLEQTLRASDGSSYTVTVVCPDDAEIPADASLRVVELVDADGARKEYAERLAKELGGEPAYARFFDITIVDGTGQTIQPSASVEVKIALDDADEIGDNVKAVHFVEDAASAGNPSDAELEVIDACLVGETVSFDASGFSVYAITDGENPQGIEPRAEYVFKGEDGSALVGVTTQIIKNMESLTEVTAPQYDNEALLGWYVYDASTGAGSWGEKVLFGTPVTVLYGSAAAVYSNSVVVPNEQVDPLQIEVRPRYTTNYGTVVFLTDYNVPSTDYSDGNVVKTSVKVGMEDGQTSVTYTLPDKDSLSVTPTNNAYTFVGWSTQAPPTTGYGNSHQYNYYSASDNRTTVDSVTVSQGATQVLYPVFKQAHWLNFKSAPTGSGATYVPPAYVENGQTAADKKPADPSWKGYKFLYWTTTPTFNEETGELIAFAEGEEPAEYDFNQQLSGDVTLYAYWESGWTTYTVIHWKQNVNDGKSTAEAANADARTYDFAEQEVIEAKVGTVVTADDVTVKTYTGFHHREDVNNDTGTLTVASSGSSVYNAYYDRDVMYMQFYTNGSGTGPANGYSDDIWINGSNYVITYSGLYGQSLQQNGYTWPNGTWSYYQNPDDASDTSGMSYLGQFVFPNSEIGAYFRAYSTTSGSTLSINFYLQNSDGTYPDSSSDSGLVASGGTFTFTDKYDGYTVSQYRRYYMDGTTKVYVDADGNVVNDSEEAWADTAVGQTAGLSAVVRTGSNNDYYWYYAGGGETINYSGTRYKGTARYSWYANNNYVMTYSGDGSYSYTGNQRDGYQYLQNPYEVTDNSNTQYARLVFTNGTVGYVQLTRSVHGYKLASCNLEIRYARSQYDVLFLDPFDNAALTVQMANGQTVQTKEGVYYGADITGYYPAAGFEPASTHEGYSFNGRWYADQGQTTQVFFHASGSAALTEAETTGLWYYVDTSGEKIYTGYVPTAEQLAMTLDNGGREYHQDEYLVYTEMPMHDVPVYAGYSKDWYWVKIDPAGGELPLDGTYSTYFWEDYGSLVNEYTIERLYVEDAIGVYYYHYAEFNEDDPDGTQYSTRRAWYSTESDTENGVPSDGKRYRPAEADEAYVFAGWYEVGEDGSLTPYNFSTEVTHNLTLRAVWKQQGDYRVYYDISRALDANGNPIAGLSVAEGATAPIDEFRYAADANVVVQSGTVESSNTTEYEFAGWYFDNQVLAAGDVFTADPKLADMYPDATEGSPDTFILRPVFVKKGEVVVPDTTSTALILDSNGGTAVEGLEASLPTGSTLNDEGTQITLTWDKMQVNASVTLPSTDVYEKAKNEFLGWAFSKDAKTPVFVAGQVVGLDNLVGSGYNGDNTNTLYAVWRMQEVPVKIQKVDAGTSSPLAGATFRLQVGDETPAFTSGADGWLADGVAGDEGADTATAAEQAATAAGQATTTGAGQAAVIELPTPTASGATNTYTLTETAAPTNYKLWESGVKISVAYDGTVTWTQADANNGEAQEAALDDDGNYIVVVTNTKNALPVKVVKIDQEGHPLEGAVFSLTSDNGAVSEQSLTSAMAGTEAVSDETAGEGASGDGASDAAVDEAATSTSEAVIYSNEALPVGQYTFQETKAPDGYNALAEAVVLTVASDRVTATGVDINHVKHDPQTGWYTIEVMNTAGVSLPNTGGPGTTWLYALGFALIVLACTLLGQRGRRVLSR